MVLEHLFPTNWTEQKLRYALLIGVIYSALSIFMSLLLFGRNSGLISVVLTSLLILPLLDDLLKKEEQKEEKEKKFILKHLLDDNKQAVVTYLFLFVAVMATYAAAVFFFHILKLDIASAFHGQLLLDFGKGGATFMFKDFWTILENNWWVLLAIFVISLFIKDGGIFFVAWNASSWGVILSYRAITSAAYVGESSLKFFGLILLLSFPFLLLEALAYILAAISGAVISDDVVKKTKYVHVFLWYGALGTAVSIGVYLLLWSVQAATWLQVLLQMVIVCLTLVLLSKALRERKYKEVFIYNSSLFVIAVACFVLGAILEALITNNVEILTKIYSISLLFSNAGG